MVPYAPLGLLKPDDNDVWFIDGPEVHMRYLGLRRHFRTRAIVVRPPGRRWWIHSPVGLADALATTLERLGAVDLLLVAEHPALQLARRLEAPLARYTRRRAGGAG